MNYILIFLLSIILTTAQKVKAQNKKEIQDTIYYKLDTSAVPLKDRMFNIEIEDKYKGYILKCKCYPWETDLVFFSRRDRSNETKNISLESFNKIKTISIPQLIEIAVKYAKDRLDKHKFFFIEPNGKAMKVTRVYLSDPRKPQGPSIDTEYIHPN